MLAATDDDYVSTDVAWAAHLAGGPERAERPHPSEYMDDPSITCPECLMTSYKPNDIEQGYCGGRWR